MDHDDGRPALLNTHTHIYIYNKYTFTIIYQFNEDQEPPKANEVIQ